ncbi:MAG: RagB/SusD family nutrient uptake outer membrane protein [Prolixibacteraceae bacterium]|nr:RagB/SusD family nutrient uptake outer membrane protein [Prolixibacteraceae bacterium]
MKLKNPLKITTLVAAVLFAVSTFNACTNLEEFPQDKVTSDVLIQEPELIQNLIAPALGQLRFLWYREGVWGMQESNSDELMFPTRGTDWFDGGVWQQQCLHTWTPVHRDVNRVWNLLNSGIASANFGISVLGTDEDVSDDVKNYRGMLRFLRDFYMYNLVDMYGLSPYRDAFDLDYNSDPVYLTREEAFNFLTNDLKQIIDIMPERAVADYGVPTRDAALMLLAKLYLNKEVYTGTAAWDSSLYYLNQIIDPGNYQLADDYFGMFGPDNYQNFRKPGDEAIFVSGFDDTDAYGMTTVVIWVQHTFHYNQHLNGDYTGNWNGCVAPEGYLKECWLEGGTDLNTDIRWADSTDYPYFAAVSGFNHGPQFNLAGEQLLTRGGDPLSYTFECPLEATEAQGVRVLKYAPRKETVSITRVSNDFVIWRYADALLMKAECLARTGDMNGALAIVNQIRVKRGAPALASMELMDILRERGRELYWEGHRRQDMIRFGTFLQPRINKEYVSPQTALILPIPQTAIEASDGLLQQNPGY